MAFPDGNLGKKKDVRRAWPWFAEFLLGRLGHLGHKDLGHKETPGAKSTVPLISISTVIP